MSTSWTISRFHQLDDSRLGRVRRHIEVPAARLVQPPTPEPAADNSPSYDDGMDADVMDVDPETSRADDTPSPAPSERVRNTKGTVYVSYPYIKS